MYKIPRKVIVDVGKRIEKDLKEFDNIRRMIGTF